MIQIGNGSYELHQPIVTHTSTHAHGCTHTHARRSVSGSFGFLCWASCRDSGSDRGASFESKFKCWCTWSSSDSSQMQHNKQEKKIIKKNRKYALKIILALSLTCFYSKWITHMKCFSTLQWSHKIGCCIKAKITHSVASIYVWMRPKKIWENMIMINKSYTIPSELWSHFCVQYFFKDWAWAISRQIRGGPDFAA